MGFFPTAAIFPPLLSFTGQTVLITGASCGLGLETAIHYVQLQASTVIITARNAERGTATVAEIEARTQTKGVVQARVLDMGSFQNVKRFVDELKRDVKTIDIVLLNAGVHCFDFEESPEGWEMDLQVNLLSTTLLGLLLLPWMRSVRKDAQQQHLGIVGSAAHMAPNIADENWPKQDILRYWNDEKHWEAGLASYATSKLLLQYAALELSKLAIDSDGEPSPIINVVCPGPVKSNIARQFVKKGIREKIIAYMWSTVKCLNTDVGARALVLAAKTSPAENGKFVRFNMTDAKYEKAVERSIRSELGQKMQAAVWGEILDVLETAVREVKDIAVHAD